MRKYKVCIVDGRGLDQELRPQIMKATYHLATLPRGQDLGAVTREENLIFSLSIFRADRGGIKNRAWPVAAAKEKKTDGPAVANMSKNWGILLIFCENISVATSQQCFMPHLFPSLLFP
jgi:hypothetical protein